MALDRIKSKWVYYDPLFTLKFNFSADGRKILRRRYKKWLRRGFRYF